jgi:HK97 family phage portal protein
MNGGSSVFKWLARILAQERRATFKDADGWFHDWMIGGSKTVSGEAIGPKTALKVIAYFAAMRAIAEDIASVPLILYRRSEGSGRERAVEHPTHKLLHDAPNPEMSAMSFRETLTQHAINKGNGYAEIERLGNRPAALWPMDPDRVTVKRDEDGRIAYEIRQPITGGTRTLQMDQVFHLHGLGYDGLVGYSLAKVAAEDLGAALAAVKGSAANFGSGSRPGGVLNAGPKKMEAIALERLRQQWEAMYSGAENKGKTAILEEGWSFTPITSTNKDAQYLELQMYLVEVMARLLRVPPSKIGHNVHGRYSNTEQQAIDYVGDAIRPWAVRWEEEIGRKLILPKTEANYFAEHLLDGLMRGDATARSARQKTLFYMGVATINEIRAWENMNPIKGEGGDTHWMQVSLQPLDKALNPSEPAPAVTVGTTDMDEEKLEDDERQFVDALVASHRGLFIDAYTALLTVQAEKIGRASKRPQFAEWHASYYAKLPDIVRRELITPINTFCAAVWRTQGGGVMPDIVTEVVGRQSVAMSERYVAASKPALCAGVPLDWSADSVATKLVDVELDNLAELMATMCGKEAATA